MTQKQLIETVKQHHPDLQDAQIRIFLNKALDEFCRKTRILQGAFKFTTNINQRYYGLDEKIIEVTIIP